MCDMNLRERKYIFLEFLKVTPIRKLTVFLLYKPIVIIPIV